MLTVYIMFVIILQITMLNAVVYAVNCIEFIASYGAWALLCLHYATTLLQTFQCMNVLSCTYTYISLIIHSKQ